MLLIVFLVGLGLPFAQARGASTTPPSDAEVVREFDAAVQKYLAIRQGISTELPALRVTDNPAEINARSDALASAIQRRRGSAPQGQFFTARVVEALRRRVSEVGARPDIRASVMPEGEEQSTVKTARVHTRYPAGSVMTTVPTALLDVLPPLPASLEYRFIGRTLVLRDIEAALVLDLANDVLPASPRK